jgi:hypothetical protein
MNAAEELRRIITEGKLAAIATEDKQAIDLWTHLEDLAERACDIPTKVLEAVDAAEKSLASIEDDLDALRGSLS